VGRTIDLLAESERRRSAIARSARPATEEAGKLIAIRLADAQAHARQALSATLVQAPDGMPTLALARRSDDLRAALDRLKELEVALAGKVRDAWEAAFVDAWEYARSIAHPDDLDPDHPEPTARDLRNARMTVIDGYDARGLVAGPIAQARRKLAAVVPSAASPTLPDKARRDALGSWRVTAARSIAAAAGQAIFTGAFRMDAIAGRLVLKPELLHKDPSLEGWRS
jgi:hypothetical protein